MEISFTDQLNRLLANNKPDRALEEIFEAFRLFKKKHPDRAREIDELESQLIMLSARMKELQNKEQTIQLSSNEIDVARARLFSSLIGVIKGLYEYPSFSEFLNTENVEVHREEPVAKERRSPAFAPVPPPVSGPVSGYADLPVYAQPEKSGPKPIVLIGIVGAVILAVFLGWMAFGGKKGVQTQTAAGPELATATATESAAADNAADKQLWETAKKRNTRDAYEMYMLAYENGMFDDSAQARINALTAADEDILWAAAQSANTRAAYEDYLKKSITHRFGAQANERISALLEAERGSVKLKELIGVNNSDTLTLNEKITRITAGLAEVKTAGDKTEVQKYLDALLASQSRYANIKTEEDFAVASSVNDRNPAGVGTVFSQRSIWAWARTSAPRAETVRFIWYDAKGEQLKVRAYKVEGYDNYRIFAQHTFDGPGRYEVRLYNDQNILIARRVFEIKS